MRKIRPSIKIDCNDEMCCQCYFADGTHYKYCALFDEVIRYGYSDEARRCKSCLDAEVTE